MNLSFRLFFYLALFIGVSFSKVYAFDVPALTGPVIDQSGFLSSSEKTFLEDKIRNFYQTGKAQIQILIVPSLNDESIESVSIQITDKWKLGTEKQDNGILLLIASEDRKLRIEVGQGLEGTLPDVIAKRIIADVMTPELKKGNSGDAVIAGVDAIIKYVNDGEFVVKTSKRSSRGSDPIVALLIWLLMNHPIIFIFVMIFAVYIFFKFDLYYLFLSGRGGYRSGGGGFGGGSGGGWSGGGGGFSGGGSSGSW